MEKEKAITILQSIKAGTAKAYISDEAIESALDMAISALEKQEAIKSCTPPSDDWEHYADRLHDIAYRSGYEQGKKDAEQDRWIPVTERLPEENGHYLVTLFDEIDSWTEPLYWNTTFGGRWQGLIEDDLLDIGNVSAWRPLPEPYEGRRDGNK